jgi:DNA polymerase II small subunit
MSKEELTKNEVTQLLGENGLFILPDAANKILKYDSPQTVVDDIVENVESGETIDVDKIQEVMNDLSESEDIDESGAEPEVEKSTPDSKSETRRKSDRSIVSGETIDPYEALESIESETAGTEDIEDVLNRKEALEKKYPNMYDEMFNRELPHAKPRINIEEDYEIKGDITGESRGKGEFEDFKSLFTDRYERMVELLSKRTGGLHKVSNINARRHGGESMTVVGLVWSKFVSKNGNYFIDLEDPKTNDLLRIGWTSDDIKDVFEQVVEDEVVAVRGNLADDGDIVWGDSEVRRGRPPIMFPDVPRKSNNTKPKKPVKAAMISDIHVGADEFYPSYWNDFVDWIRNSPDVKYLFVAGDIVEGIGVYPDQREELKILDIYDQYAMTAKMFDQIPDDVKIFVSVGNHDSVRLAEPQPTLEEKFTRFYDDDIEFVGNPVTVDVNGVNIQMYHGMSLYALSESVPGLDAEDPIPIMELMLKKRHVAPVYGKNVRLAPEQKDYLVIEHPPDVLHCGHVHKYGQGSYNGVKMINTATWQGQTAFQKSKGIEPDPGYWSVVDLSTKDVEKYTVDDV